MKRLRFSGHSDDTFGEYAVTREDHDNCASGKPIVFLVSSESTGESLCVIGQYAIDATDAWTWSIGVALVDEGAALPAWPMRFTAEHPYSHALEIDAPDDVRIVHLPKTDGES